MVLKVLVDNIVIVSDNGVLKLKLSSAAEQGLSFDAEGNLIGTPGTASGGVKNKPGNAIGPTTAAVTDTLDIVGMNSTVSRHMKYTGGSAFIRENDGPVMTKLVEGNDGLEFDSHCIAYHMIPHNQ